MVRAITRIIRASSLVDELVQGLDRSAGSAEGDRLAEELLSMRRREADLAVARAFSSLGAGARERFVRLPGDRARRAVESLLTSGAERDRLAACRLAPVAASAAIVAALSHLVRDGSGSVAESAAAALRRLAQDPPEGAGLAGALDVAVASAASGFPQHRRRAVIEAAAALAARAGPAVGAWLRVAPEESMLALRAAIRKDASAGDALRMLKDDRLAPACLERLAGERDAAFRAAWLELSPALLLHPRRRRALRRAARPERLIPAGEERARMPVAARRAAAPTASRLAIDDAALARVCASGLTDEDAAAQLACVRVLDARSGACADALRDFACAGEARAARSALVALCAAGAEAPAMAARRPEAGIRAHAAVELERGDPLSSPGAARLALERGRGAFVRRLRAEMCGGSAGRRVAALLAARRLGVAAECEFEALACAGDHDARVAATAALALGVVGTVTAREALARLAGAPDARVRANAIEALAMSGGAASLIEERRFDPDARSRGNAVLASLRRPAGRGDGLDALRAMLDDPRAPHRLSGLWVVEREVETGVAHRVAALAREAGEPAVAARARRCARRLIAALEG